MSLSIKFYDPKSPYYEFSNFFEEPFNLDGRTWPTVEHYFQAAKFTDPEYVEVIRNCSTPCKAFVLARQKLKGGYAAKWCVNLKGGDRRLLNDIILEYCPRVSIRPDWDEVRVDVMQKALMAKFSQSKRLKTMLLETQDKIIMEDSPRDSFWGIGKDGKGTNMLGHLLMKVRDEVSHSEV